MNTFVAFIGLWTCCRGRPCVGGQADNPDPADKLRSSWLPRTSSRLSLPSRSALTIASIGIFIFSPRTSQRLHRVPIQSTYIPLHYLPIGTRQLTISILVLLSPHSLTLQPLEPTIQPTIPCQRWKEKCETYESRSQSTSILRSASRISLPIRDRRL